MKKTLAALVLSSALIAQQRAPSLQQKRYHPPFLGDLSSCVTTQTQQYLYNYQFSKYTRLFYFCYRFNVLFTEKETRDSSKNPNTPWQKTNKKV